MVKLRKWIRGNQGNGNTKRKFSNKGVWDTGKKRSYGKKLVRGKICRKKGKGKTRSEKKDIGEMGNKTREHMFGSLGK